MSHEGRNQRAAGNVGEVSRREVLKAGAVSLFGAGMTGLWSPVDANAAGTQAKRCILLFLSGGPSHVDMWDPKPSAPSEYRGPFAAIPTSVAGICISEHLPRMAKLADQYTILRSLTGSEVSHTSATQAMLATSEGMADSAVLFGVRTAAWVPVRHAETGSSHYGEHDFGRACLEARRQLEAGTRFVAATLPGWDTHGNNFGHLKENLLPKLDQAFSALLTDLKASGLLSETLVVCVGEFGRTPRINEYAGRDHHAAAFSAVLAGAGVSGGRVIGATDARGMEPVEHPISVAQFGATIRTLVEGTPSGSDLAKDTVVSELLG